MAKRMSTASRYDRLREKQAVSRAENGERKRRERVNRDKRIKEVMQKGAWPFTPAVMSWVSVQLDKPTRRIVKHKKLWRAGVVGCLYMRCDGRERTAGNPAGASEGGANLHDGDLELPLIARIKTYCVCRVE